MSTLQNQLNRIEAAQKESARDFRAFTESLAQWRTSVEIRLDRVERWQSVLTWLACTVIVALLGAGAIGLVNLATRLPVPTPQHAPANPAAEPKHHADAGAILNIDGQSRAPPDDIDVNPHT
jgi:hypothetical protein